MSETTYTEEQLKAAVDKAVAEATASLQTQVSDLQNSQAQSALDQAVATAKAEREEEVKDLQRQLDEAVLEAQKAKDEKTALETQVAEEKEAAARETRREERLTKLKEEAGFPEDFIEKHADRFIAMSDEEFSIRLEECALIRGKKEEAGEPPVSTALHASRSTKDTKKTSSLSEIRELRRAGINPSRVVGY